jgi:signal transduction histidine kinase
MKNKVLLTSEFPQPESQPLAALLHDANNKLTPILTGLDERESEFACDRFRGLMNHVEEVRAKVKSLRDIARKGAVDPHSFSCALQEVHGQLSPLLPHVPDDGISKRFVFRDEIREVIEEFETAIERGQQFVRTHSLHEKPTLDNISRFVSDIVLSYQRRYPRISFCLTIDEDCVISFRPNSIKTALENLLNNAVQSLPETGGEISVDLRTKFYDAEEKPFIEIEEGTYTSIEIEDNGSGISDEVMDSLPHSPKSTKAGGSGLGLASARDSICNHDGHLFVESEKGRGTKVTALLPSSFPPPPRMPTIEGHEGGGCVSYS